MTKKPFSELGQRGKGAAIVTLAVSLVVIFTAERDLRRRPQAQVRGSKRLWRLVSLNALGAAGDLRYGRRG